MAIFPNINPTTTSGTDLGNLLNSFRDSVVSGFLGTARPVGLTKGGYWVDSSLEISSNVFRLYLFDGAADVLMFSINKSTGRITLPAIEAGVSIKQASADAFGPVAELFKARVADLGKVLAGDQLGKFTYASTDDTGAKISDAASIEAVALENHTGALQGTKLEFYTKLSGTATKFKSLEIGDSINVFNFIVPYYSANDANSQVIGFRKSRGTISTPTAVLADDQLAFIGARGHDGTNYNSGSKASMLMMASENHTPTANGTYMIFRTTGNGTTTIKTRVSINQDGGVGLHGNTSGYVQIRPPAAPTNHTLILPGTQGAADTYLKNDGSGNLSWASAGGAGANTALSNLDSVAINTDLVFTATPQVSYQSPSTTTHYIRTANPPAAADLNSSHNLAIETGASSWGSTGNLTFKTPTATNQGWGFGTVKSGDFTIDVGRQNGNVAKGRLFLKQNVNGGGTTGVIGHVLTQIASTGECEWQAPAGGGGASWTKYTIAHTALQTAALTNNTALLTLPAKGIVEGIMIKTTTAFAGSGITDYDVTVGITGNESKFLPSYDADSAVSGSNYDISSVAVGGDDFNATEAIKVFATAVGANLSNSTAGSLDIYVKYSTLP